MLDLVGHQKLIYRSLTDTKHLAKLQGENHIWVILKELGIIITVLCQKALGNTGGFFAAGRAFCAPISSLNPADAK